MRKGKGPALHPALLGDLVISAETAQRQSNRFGLNDFGMITLLLVHGLLHLVGYEHEGTRKGAQEMARKQKELFQKCRNIGMMERWKNGSKTKIDS
jgi:probable rRNA maturation factor